MSNIKSIHVINDTWEDKLLLDFNTFRLIRENKESDNATFKIFKNILHVIWDFWDEEFYFEYNNIFYKSDKIMFKTLEWEEYCYINEKIMIVYQLKENLLGEIKQVNNDGFFIEWKKYNNNFLLDILNIKYYNNSKLIKQQPFIKSKEEKIPNIFHFVYGFKKQDQEFELYKYLAIKSAIRINKPLKSYFHYFYEPFGKYWDKIKPYLTLEHVNPPSEIYGNTLYHYAHQADIIRLQKLNQYGGIYLDIDTICLRSFQDLLNYDFVIGIQGNKDNQEIYGLCNAVILSKPNSPFILKWIDSYTSFRSKGRDNYWDEHSVLMPLKLSYQFPSEVTILENSAFYNPLWNNIHDILFNTQINNDEYKHLIEKNYCIHLWDTYTNDYLSKLDEKTIINENTLYNIFTRKFIKNKISILMLTYNRNEKTIECLESYLSCLDMEIIQELIIFDNNSNKQLKNYLIDFQRKNKKIKIIFHHENIGVCGGRLELFKKATGDIICSLDSDAKLLDSNFFEKVRDLLYDEKYGIIGISGAYINSWNFGEQEDIDENDTNEYFCHHIAGCCQVFRKDLFHFGFQLDPFYGFFWCEDTDLSCQSLALNKINYRIDAKKYIEHHWGGSGASYHELFEKNWNYLKNKWKNKIIHHIC
jgi:hypothetical protein